MCDDGTRFVPHRYRDGGVIVSTKEFHEMTACAPQTHIVVEAVGRFVRQGGKRHRSRRAKSAHEKAFVLLAAKGEPAATAAKAGIGERQSARGQIVASLRVQVGSQVGQQPGPLSEAVEAGHEEDDFIELGRIRGGPFPKPRETIIPEWVLVIWRSSIAERSRWIMACGDAGSSQGTGVDGGSGSRGK